MHSLFVECLHRFSQSGHLVLNECKLICNFSQFSWSCMTGGAETNACVCAHVPYLIHLVNNFSVGHKYDGCPVSPLFRPLLLYLKSFAGQMKSGSEAQAGNVIRNDAVLSSASLLKVRICWWKQSNEILLSF